MDSPALSHYIEIPGLKIRMRRPPWPLALLIVMALIALVSFLDYLAGPEPEFSIFYLIPITVAVFFSGGIAGIFTSLVCAAAWLAADVISGAAHPDWLVFLWDDLVQLGFFLLHTWVISTLLRALREVRALSLRDPLTAAANWRNFEEQAEAKIRMARRSRAPVTLAYIDLDNFKKLNDTFGHQMGNEVLKTVAASIQSQIRPSDLLARLGGDEFGLLIDDPRSEEVRLVLDRVKTETERRLSEKAWNVTLSVGAVTFSTPPESLAPLIKAADELMYQVKQSGKNRIQYVVRDCTPAG